MVHVGPLISEQEVPGAAAVVVVVGGGGGGGSKSDGHRPTDGNSRIDAPQERRWRRTRKRRRRRSGADAPTSGPADEKTSASCGAGDEHEMFIVCITAPCVPAETAHHLFRPGTCAGGRLSTRLLRMCGLSGMCGAGEGSAGPSACPSACPPACPSACWLRVLMVRWCDGAMVKRREDERRRERNSACCRLPLSCSLSAPNTGPAPFATTPPHACGRACAAPASVRPIFVSASPGRPMLTGRCVRR